MDNALGLFPLGLSLTSAYGGNKGGPEGAAAADEDVTWLVLTLIVMGKIDHVPRCGRDQPSSSSTSRSMNAL